MIFDFSPQLQTASTGQVINGQAKWPRCSRPKRAGGFEGKRVRFSLLLIHIHIYETLCASKGWGREKMSLSRRRFLGVLAMGAPAVLAATRSGLASAQAGEG